jgi:hypothetical protein
MEAHILRGKLGELRPVGEVANHAVLGKGGHSTEKERERKKLEGFHG